jgi:hypothetical protein
MLSYLYIILAKLIIIYLIKLLVICILKIDIYKKCCQFQSLDKGVCYQHLFIEHEQLVVAV